MRHYRLHLGYAFAAHGILDKETFSLILHDAYQRLLPGGQINVVIITPKMDDALYDCWPRRILSDSVFPRP
jgi:hypothetical protein